MLTTIHLTEPEAKAFASRNEKVLAGLRQG